MKSSQWQVTSDQRTKVTRAGYTYHSSLITHHLTAFTLIELLVVISILGILAALTVPALKNLGKSNAATSASQQMLDDIGYARQLAINNHTTVYMVFVPTNYYNQTFISGLQSLTPPAAQTTALTLATNLVAYQLTGYNFVSRGTLGDQPGQHAWRYLSAWRILPQGFMVGAQKFTLSPPLGSTALISSQSQPLYADWNRDYPHSDGNAMYVFTNVNNLSIPFPTEASPLISLPDIAFNYLGQLTFDGVTPASRDEYIPLAAGNVSYPVNGTTKIPVMDSTKAIPILNGVLENPPGNSTNISYNIVHIDALTGRATLEYHKIQ
jgi:prepilin-type N-terminal cleavage/methylation domain-containing protein